MPRAPHILTRFTRKFLGLLAIAALALTGIAILAMSWTFTTASAQSQPVPPDAMPSNPQSSCTVSSTTFNGWFQSGTVAVNGVVNPANSVGFPTNNTNCDFYQWSMQMFLWLTSPAPATYGGGSHVFDSSIFFDVSPADAKGRRFFRPHLPGRFIFSLRAAKPGPHGLPVILAKDGRMLEVHPPKLSARGKPLILNSAGKQVEAERITIQDHKAIFHDKAGKVITSAKPILAQQAANSRLVAVQKFIIDGRPIFVDPFNNVIDTEEGQADGGVLLTQNNSLVYYTIVANDVYAYFLTQTKRTMPPQNVPNAQFPTTQANLNSIVSYAGHSFPDGQALAIEVKAAWVEASSLPNKNQYVTINADVPIFQPNSQNTEWTQTGKTKKVELALVGIHVVGSVNGHPEMIWATFEHFGNAPNGQYQYVSSPSGTVTTVNQNTAGSWLFTTNNAGQPFNCMNQTAQSVPANSNSTAHVSIQLNTPSAPCPAPTTISPTNVIRWKPFGAAYDQQPNPADTTPVSNSSIISINNATQIPASSSGRGQNLPGADVRDNYFMLGATWTIGGAVPTNSYGTPPPPTANEVGTSLLANTTMETYEQGNSNLFGGGNNGKNCLFCHAYNTVPTSHIFCEPGQNPNCSLGLQPLPPFVGQKKLK